MEQDYEKSGPHRDSKCFRCEKPYGEWQDAQVYFFENGDRSWYCSLKCAFDSAIDPANEPSLRLDCRLAKDDEA